MILGLVLLLCAFGGAYAIMLGLVRLRVHRLDDDGRKEPWKGPSRFWQTNMLTASNYDETGRKQLVLFKVALLATWVVFMAALLLVGQQLL